MNSQPRPVPIVVSREGVNDDTVFVLEWLVAEGAEVQPGQPIVSVETTKSVVDLEATGAGFVFPLAPANSEVAVGAVIGFLAPTPDRPEEATPAGGRTATDDQIITEKARLLMTERGLAPDVFAELAVVRTGDVHAYLAAQQPEPVPELARLFNGAPLDPDTDWDATLDDELNQQLRSLLTRLRQRMKARFNRHVPTGELLHDRWELAREYGFGDGTSVYDSCVITGAVTVGKHCWVGPNTALDGSGGGLVIGDHVDVGGGSHIYTHNTIQRALTGGRAPAFHAPTRIGNCCFIGPYSVIAPGTVLGDHCFVAAGSYVEGTFPDGSFLAGSPATRVGTVTVGDGRARIRRDHEFPEQAGP